MTHDDELPMAMPLPALRGMADAVANELRSAASPSNELRERFIHVRAALFQRGIFAPVLVRFDSATVPKATNEEIADQLAAVAQSLA